ncbi:hypothetical protein Ahy_A02g009084 [Arachis hypogaea]|uniref:Ubiquitin-like protease family profile domain-containing protein n=1 Tax=Arachis hypogaea TaxID=3818 RepID=A0A445EFU4_ARAHY|nr:hypothetical protein Ahy_A02g009084 [Arachis hypogaea]
MAHSSTSPLNKTQTFKLRATFQIEKIELVAEISRNHQQKIELSINNFKRKRRNITQEKMAARNQPGRNQTKDLKCATHLLSDKFRNMSEEKKIIVRDLGFGGLMHIPPLRVHHQFLRELANNFKLGENRLEMGYGSFKITPRKIGDALGINATGDLFPQKVDYKKLSEDDKVIFRRFQGKTLKSLTDEMMDIGVGNEEERLMFKRIFILYIQMAFLLPMTINKISPVHLAPIFEMDSITERNWGACFDLYRKKRAERPPKPWIANWSKEELVKRMSVETEEILYVLNNDCLPSRMDSRKRKKSQEDSDSDLESESSDETQSKKKKIVVEHSSSEEDQYNDGYSTSQNEADLRSTEGLYVSSEIIPDVNLGSDDPSSQGCTEQSSVNNPAESMLSPIQQSASELADSNMMVVRERTPSEALAIYPAAEDAAALLMMARTTSYAPRTDQMPSFSLGLTDSSQEEASTQEGASMQEAERAKSPEAANLLEQLDNLVQKIARNKAKEESKSPQIQRETVGESSGRFETPAGINQNTDDMKQKCYIWGTRVKTYTDGRTNEYENMCTLMAQDKYILTKMHIASLQAATFIEAEIVSAMCLILNQTNDKRFQEQVLSPPNIVNMAISKHPNGELISPKTNKEFRVEDYPSFIPFIDAKKLTSHPYIFAPVCYADHWWLWVIDTRKWRFHILDPLHKKAPSDQRKQLNKFTGYVISRMRVYVGGEPLKKGEKEKEIKASYWLELIEPENIKKGKYEWDNWKQDEVDHYRVEYASRILFNEMSKERDEAIRASNAIRLSKPSSVLLSPFCQINSTDIENV